MRYRLRTLLIATFAGPAVLAMVWWSGTAVLTSLGRRSADQVSSGPPGSPLFVAAGLSIIVLYPLTGFLILLTGSRSTPGSKDYLTLLELTTLLVAAFAAVASAVLFLTPAQA